MTAAVHIHRLPLRAASQALAGAGAGLLVWLSVSIALLLGRAGPLRELASLQLRGLALAGLLLLLAAPALIAWREPAPWPGRARLAWGLALVATLSLAGLQLWPPAVPGWTTLSAAIACLAALALASCLGQAGQSADTLSLGAPTQLALALLGGMALLLVLVSLHWPGTMPVGAPLPSLALLGAAGAGLLLAGWWNDGGLRRSGRGWTLLLLTLLPWGLALSAHLLPKIAWLAWLLVALSVLAGMLHERVLAGGWR